jgi:hypothetical protein
MADLAVALCIVINDAQECGTLPLPNELVADKHDQTLKNLIRYLDPIYDPVRNPNGRFRRYREPCRLVEIDPNALDTGT